MTEQRWSVDQLGALSDEWIAEREHFLTSMQTYLATQLPHVPTEKQQPLDSAAYQTEVAAIGARLEQFLRTMEGTVWYALQHRVAEYAQELEAQFGAPFRADAERLAAVIPPLDAVAHHTTMRHTVGLVQHIMRIYRDLNGMFDFATIRFAGRLLSRMKYLLYPLRLSLPALQRYWLLESADLGACEPPPNQADPASGIHRYDVDGHRGAYTLYVPEAYHPDRAWPLLLTLHGGSGNDEDFLWAWLKYAKSYGYVLMSAKSFGSTWYAWDAPSLLLMLDEMQERYHLDTNRILLTGLSDGGSFSYEVGFSFPERFAGLAVVAGILRPHQRTPQTSQLPVYIAHGERDQLFPVAYIRMVAEKLRELGHNVTYHEIADFGHAYPAGENTAILDWFASLGGVSNG